METVLAVVVVALLAYNAYFAYNVMVLVPRYGVRFFKLPFGKKVWKISLVEDYAEDEEDYDEEVDYEE